MILAAGAVRALRSAREFVRDRRGISAVEFAAVLPFVLVAYLGSVEVGNGIATKLRVSLIARTLADLATQYISIRNADMSGIMSASSAVVAPYSAAPLVITLSDQVFMYPRLVNSVTRVNS